jgi:hypothetical protein
MLKTVANRTAAGRTRKMFSGRLYTWANNISVVVIPRPKYSESLSVISRTITMSGNPTAVAVKILNHSRSR